MENRRYDASRGRAFPLRDQVRLAHHGSPCIDFIIYFLPFGSGCQVTLHGFFLLYDSSHAAMVFGSVISTHAGRPKGESAWLNIQITFSPSLVLLLDTVVMRCCWVRCAIVYKPKWLRVTVQVANRFYMLYFHISNCIRVYVRYDSIHETRMYALMC